MCNSVMSSGFIVFFSLWQLNGTASGLAHVRSGNWNQIAKVLVLSVSTDYTTRKANGMTGDDIRGEFEIFG